MAYRTEPNMNEAVRRERCPMPPHRAAARIVAYSLLPWFWWSRLVAAELAEIAVSRIHSDRRADT